MDEVYYNHSLTHTGDQLFLSYPKAVDILYKEEFLILFLGLVQC